MTAGFGVDRAADGQSGTTSQDIRKIFGGLYQPGIISGCKITQTASLDYVVEAGVVAIAPVDGEIILAPVPASTVSTTAGPSSGDRFDIIWVQQHYPSIEGDANVVLGVGPVLPERAVELQRYHVLAGMSTTNEAIRVGDYDYSVPYGGSLGQLHYHNVANTIDLPEPITRFGHKTIYLPTDRQVEWSISATLSAVGAYGFDNSKYCEYGFLPNFGGSDWVLWTTPGLHQAWQTVQFSAIIPMSQGSHDVNYGLFRMVGPGTGRAYYGTDGLGYGRRGIEFTLRDMGPV